MKLNTFGLALLIIAFIVNCANIVEPNAGSSAAATILTLISFAIIVHESHNVWESGYWAAHLDMMPDPKPSPELHMEPTLFKCGMPECSCANDPRYVVADD